jgi:hypothetical protein
MLSCADLAEGASGKKGMRDARSARSDLALKEKRHRGGDALIPYIGYPRALSALTCVNEVIPEARP